MKKFLYSLIASVMFVAPIWYWLSTWWGLSLERPPTVRRLIYIYSTDNTVVTITAINLVLYVFAMWKILTMVKRSGAKNTGMNVGKPNTNVDVPPMLNVKNGSATDISKWEALYGANRRVDNTPAPQMQTKPMSQTQIPTQPQRQERVQEVQREEQPQPQTQTTKSEDSNVVNIAPVTANDVYRQQIKYVLADGGYEFIGNCAVNGVDVDFMAIAESDTFVVGIINGEYGEIVANDDAEFGDNPTIWYTGEHKYNSPVWEAKNVAIAVKRMIDEVLPNDNGIEVIPVVVIPNATIVNADDVMDSWQNLGVMVTRFMNKTELPDLLDVLPDKEGADVLDSYRTFAQTLMKYFKSKEKGKTKKVIG